MSFVNEFDKKFQRRQASYMMVTMLAMLDRSSPDGTARLSDIVNYFKGFYQQRQYYGKLPEKDDKDMAKVSSMSDREIRNLLLKNPINALKGYIAYDPGNEVLRFTDLVILDEETKHQIRNVAYKHLYYYYKEFDPHQLKLQELDNLPIGFAATAADIAAISGHNQVKGIHPIDKEDYKAVIVLCTIGGDNYPNQWLDEEKNALKYYLEGRTDRKTGERTYNLDSRTNKVIIKSRQEGYPIYIFVREKKGELFHFAGEFLYEQVEQEETGDYYFILKRKESEKPMNVSKVIREKNGFELGETSHKNIITGIYDYITSHGFVYEESLIKNFYLSLKTKPFVILAGISGTGKSKLVELFAEAVGANSENGRFKLIPVKPDWNDSSDLLGYKNLEGKFLPGPLTKVIQEAMKNKDKPYFVCLDEMNLARVEYYFSDFLSLMETRKLYGEELRSDVLFKGSDFPLEEDKKEYSGLYIPDNLYIVGTVNMDETTHPFSKKVLDRANTIEFFQVYLDYFVSGLEGKDCLDVDNAVFKSEYCYLKDCLDEFAETVQKVVDELVEINQVLTQANLHVGYRVRDEICFYMIYNQRFNLMPWDDAMDWQLLQKILPRIQGSSRQICQVLGNLFELATGVGLETDYEASAEKAAEILDSAAKIKWPRSAQKIAYMLGRYQEDGFTSFWA
ncbi:MAG: AAA family ATPase [Syntrophomonadaceae bacterium]|nr:AAA family ATPase [Syntrophomonadaceae bacterium]